jgi:transcriptional regulator with XRE-family HTH domain
MTETLASYVKRLIGGRRVDDVAGAAGIGRSTLYDIRSGKATRPDSEVLKRLAPIIGADEDILLFLAGHLSELAVGTMDPRAVELGRWVSTLPPHERDSALQMMEGVRVLFETRTGAEDVTDPTAVAHQTHQEWRARKNGGGEEASPSGSTSS